MEWYYIAAALVYLVICAIVYRCFSFIYVSGKGYKINKAIDITLTLAWPLWLPLMMTLDVFKRLRGESR